MVNASRFGQGMTFDEYLRFIASPANLAREGSAAPRRDWSDFMRQAYDAARIPPAHTEAWRWLVAQPGPRQGHAPADRGLQGDRGGRA